MFTKILGIAGIIMVSVQGKPTGPFGVGTMSYHLIDKSREESRSKDSSHRFRELMVQVWYPAETTGLQEPQPYVSDRLAAFIEKKSTEKKSWFFGSGYIGVGVNTHSYRNAPISCKQNKYAVLVFSPGYGCPCHTYTSLLEELASHGFVVFGVNHTYTSDPVEFPDGRIIELHPEAFLQDEAAIRFHDLQFVLDEIQRIDEHDTHEILTHHLDMDHIGIFGHSMGATVALELGQKDVRCKAVIALDGMIQKQEVYTKPLMIMYNSEQGTFAYNDRHAPKLDLVSIFDAMKKTVGELCRAALNDVFEIQWKAHHMTFSDYFLLTHQAKDHEREMQNLEQVKLLMTEFFMVHLAGNSKEAFVSRLSEPANDPWRAHYVYLHNKV